MNYNLDDSEKLILEICGAYRRQKEFSGDIDISLTIKLCNDYFKEFKQKIKNTNLLLDDSTNKKL